MTSPLTKSRDNKMEIVRQMHDICFLLSSYPKGGLDRMDMRILKRLLKDLKLLQERARPL